MRKFGEGYKGGFRINYKGGMRIKRTPMCKQHSVIMPDMMHEEVVKKARERDCTINELIRTYIEWGLENDGIQ